MAFPITLFQRSGGRMLHDLLPVARKQSNVGPIADRIRSARESLGVPVAIENVSSYWHPGRAEMGEGEFLARICEIADCGFLLDVNNLYVNSVNFGLELEDWLREAPLERVVQIHVAGHEWFGADVHGLGDACPPHSPGALVIDTHGADIPDPVFVLLARVLRAEGSSCS